MSTETRDIDQEEDEKKLPVPPAPPAPEEAEVDPTAVEDEDFSESPEEEEKPDDIVDLLKPKAEIKIWKIGSNTSVRTLPGPASGPGCRPQAIRLRWRGYPPRGATGMLLR